MIRTRLGFEAEALPHLKMLFAVALRLAGNAADAEDLVQEAIFRAYCNWDRYVPGTNAKGWLVTVLRHTFINEYRVRHRRRQILEQMGPPTPTQATLPSFDDLVDGEVMLAIEALPLTYRDVVVLRDVEQLCYEEIARRLGVPVGTVKSRLHRAREILKESLTDYAVSTGLIKR